MIIALVLSGLGGAFGYLAPMIIQRALDEAVPAGNYKYLFILVGILVAVYGCSVVFNTIRSRLMLQASQNII